MDAENTARSPAALHATTASSRSQACDSHSSRPVEACDSNAGAATDGPGASSKGTRVLAGGDKESSGCAVSNSSPAETAPVEAFDAGPDKAPVTAAAAPSDTAPPPCPAPGPAKASISTAGAAAAARRAVSLRIPEATRSSTSTRGGAPRGAPPVAGSVAGGVSGAARVTVTLKVSKLRDSDRKNRPRGPLAARRIESAGQNDKEVTPPSIRSANPCSGRPEATFHALTTQSGAEPAAATVVPSREMATAVA